MAVKQPGLESHQPCASGSQIIYAWAMDAPRLDLPDGVGFRVGADSTIKYLVLQVMNMEEGLRKKITFAILRCTMQVWTILLQKETILEFF